VPYRLCAAAGDAARLRSGDGIVGFERPPYLKNTVRRGSAFSKLCQSSIHPELISLKQLGKSHSTLINLHCDNGDPSVRHYAAKGSFATAALCSLCASEKEAALLKCV
jgi:hypothetical protein